MTSTNIYGTDGRYWGAFTIIPPPNADRGNTMPTKMHLCNECNQCSAHKPQPLDWGHECWARTKDGYRIVECESYIEEIPVVDILMLEAAATNPTGKE